MAFVVPWMIRMLWIILLLSWQLATGIDVPVLDIVLHPAESVTLSTTQTDPFIFTCTTTSNPAANISWVRVNQYTGGVILTGATENVTIIEDLIQVISTLSYTPQKEHNGDNIRCTGINRAMTSPRITHSVTLIIQYPPNVVNPISGYTSFDPVTESSREPLSLTCSVNGVPNPNTLTYTWSSDCGTGKGSTSQIISVARRLDMHNKQCYCTVTHSETGWSQTSPSVTFIVHIGALTIVLHPATRVTLNTTQTAPFTFACTTMSYPAANISWERVNQHTGAVTLTGATESGGLIQVISTLLYTPQKEHNGDKIRCTGINRAMTIPQVSQAATLIIQYPPNFVNPILGYISFDPVTESSTEYLNLTCSVNGVSNPDTLTYTWSSGCGTGKGSTSQIINVPRSRDMNNKQCYCTVTHSETGWNQNSQSVTFIIHYVPDVTVNVSSADMTEGGSIQLECHPSGVPDIYTYIDWTQHVNGVRVREFTGSKLLHLSNVSFENSGEYRCNVKNIVGIGTGSESITLKYAPKVVEISDLSVVINGTATLSVKFIADPQPTVMWYTDGSNSSLDTNLVKFSISILRTDVSWTFYETPVIIPGYEATLTIRTVQEQDYAVYHAILDNGLTTDSQIPRFSAYLTQLDKPQAPVDVRAACDVTTAIVSWVSQFNGGLKQTFHIEHHNNGQVVYITHEDPGRGKDGTAAFTDLQPGRNNTFVMYAKNNLGSSETIERSCQTKQVMVSVSTPAAEADSSINVAAVAAGVAGPLLVIIIIILIVVICLVLRRLKSQTKTQNKRSEKNEIILSDMASLPPVHTDDAKDAPYDDIRDTYDVIVYEKDVAQSNYINPKDAPASKNDITLPASAQSKDGEYVHIVPDLMHPTSSEQVSGNNCETREYEATSFGERAVQYKNTRSEEATERYYEKLRPEISTKPSRLSISPYENKMVDPRIAYENV